MEFSHYLRIFHEKSSLEVQSITRSFLETWRGEHALQICIIILVLIGFTILNSRINKKILLFSMGVCMLFILYSLGLWMMYLISMPLEEALNLAGYQRYMDTIVQYLFGLSFIVIMPALVRFEARTPFNLATFLLGMVLLSVTLLGGGLEETKNIFTRQRINMDSYQKVVWHIEESLAHLNPNPMLSHVGADDYYMYTPSIDTINYASYYIDYRLYQKDVRHVDTIGNDNLWEYEFLAVTEVTDEIMDLFSLYSSETPKVGTYRIDQMNQQIGNKLPTYKRE